MTRSMIPTTTESSSDSRPSSLRISTTGVDQPSSPSPSPTKPNSSSIAAATATPPSTGPSTPSSFASSGSGGGSGSGSTSSIHRLGSSLTTNKKDSSSPDPQGDIVRKKSKESPPTIDYDDSSPPNDHNESYDSYTVIDAKSNVNFTDRSSWLDGSSTNSSDDAGAGAGDDKLKEGNQKKGPNNNNNPVIYREMSNNTSRGNNANTTRHASASAIANFNASAANTVDPDGILPPDGVETRGESIAPTPDDENDNNTLDSYDEEEVLSTTDGNGDGNAVGRNSNDAFHNNNSNNGGSGTGNDDIEEQRRRRQKKSSSSSSSSSSSEENKLASKPKYSKFPGIPLLILIVVFTILVFGGLVGVLTWYLWDKQVLQPLPPPTSGGSGDGDGNNDAGMMTPLVPTPTTVTSLPPPPNNNNPSSIQQQQIKDAELLRLFSTIPGIGASVYSNTTAGLAASWILYEDPSRNINNNNNDSNSNIIIDRSDNGWIQRYLLVYLYYSTTKNRSTTWLSCNPSTGKDEVGSTDDNADDNDKDMCRFTYPTELPGGKIIYDLVPSYRWLSGVDECQWGGVACGKTVTDDDVDSTTTRLAVTAIVLADQYLQGSIVTEVTALPQLELLDLSHNGLTGQLPEEFRSLKTLRLQYNAMTGTIPVDLFDSEGIMTELNIGSNSMTGKLPNEIGLASQMERLYVFDNKLTGTIPAFGNMPLRTFQGHVNQFNGPLPFDADYGGIWPDTIRVWWSYQNQITGSIPNNINFLSNLEDLRLQDNKLTGIIPETIADLSNLFRFEVQSNFLSGTVPEEISSIPQLRDVKVQFNSFTGVIPTSLCFLESMEVLEADCLVPADDGSVTSFLATTTECYCCTSCCDPVTEECVTY